MFKKQLLAVLTLLLISCVLSSLFAQAVQIQRCADSTRILPPVDAQEMPKSGTDTFANKLKFQLGWDKLAPGSCHHNPPNPIVSEQVSLARWVYFWNFGDGTFSRDSAPVHTFPEGTYVVQAAVKPIYSDDDDPLGFVVDTIVVGPGKADAPMAYEDSIKAGKSLALHVNWASSRPQGRLLFALSYPKFKLAGDAPRNLYLVYPDNMFRFRQVQSGAQPNSNYTEMFNGIQHRVYEWRINAVENVNVPHDENSVIVELEVDSLVANLLPDTSSQASATVMAMIRMENPKSDQKEDILGSSSAKAGTPNDDVIFNTTGFQGGDVGVGTPFFDGGFTDMSSQLITLNWASDPNGISVEPQVLEPGTVSAPLKYEIQFYNGGTATAWNIAAEVVLDPLLQNNGVGSPITLSQYPAGFDFSTLLETTARWQDTSAGLPSIGDSYKLGFSQEHAFGHIQYQVSTKANRVLNAGEKIRATAHIDMENSSVVTNEALVRVEHLSIRYPCVFGFKAYYNFNVGNNAFHRSGFNAALTMRKALCKMPNPQNRYFFQSRIPKSELPAFWWQAELGYGQSKLQRTEADSLQLGFLDLTPVMLRFIAKKPDLRVGNLVFKRGWGLSAGYTSSFLLHGKGNGGQSINLSNWSFGDRLDHSFSASLDLLNLVGQPGLSVGMGWRWRNSAVTGQREWYNHPFVYAHYSFSHRLRYEL